MKSLTALLLLIIPLHGCGVVDGILKFGFRDTKDIVVEDMTFIQYPLLPIDIDSETPLVVSIQTNKETQKEKVELEWELDDDTLAALKKGVKNTDKILEAKKSGDVTVTVRWNKRSVHHTVTIIDPKEVSFLVVTPSEITHTVLKTPEEISFTATARNGRGEIIETPIVWGLNSTIVGTLGEPTENMVLFTYTPNTLGTVLLIAQVGRVEQRVPITYLPEPPIPNP